jgi:acyl-CoA reductase-like NAD-dependent aldehyde dehydrogenase
MRYLVQAFLALAVLIGTPIVFEAPEETWMQAAAAVAALVLAGLAYRGVVGYVNSRRPKRFHDSVMAPKHPPKPPA